MSTEHRIILTALTLLLTAGPAMASEQSKILYSRGLVEIAAERDREALKLFDAAVAADGTDAMALYYRGVTRGRLGDDEGAVADLEAALRQRPEFDRASFELGLALLRLGRAAEAKDPLLAARDDREVGSRATLYAGIALLRLGKLDESDALLQEASTFEDQQQAATYYRGVVAYQQGRRYGARSLLEEVIAADPDAATATEARAILEEIGTDPRPYVLSAFTGFQYDSNVLLAPTGNAVQNDLRISEESDTRSVLGAAARWTPLRGDFGRMQVGYDFHQSLHFDLREFDIQSHGVGGDISGNRGRWDWGTYAWYDFHLLDGSRFLSRLAFLPWVGWRADEHWRTELSLRLRHDDFYGDEFGVRDASHLLAGLRQFGYLTDDRFGWIGYRHEVVDPSSDAVPSRRFGLDAHEFELGGSWAVGSRVGFEADYTFRAETYSQASKVRFDGGSGLQARRRDDVHRAQAAIRVTLTDHFALVGGVGMTDSRSTQRAFRYDRWVTSLTIEAQL